MAIPPGSQRRYGQPVDGRPDYSWYELVPEQHGPWEKPGWSCCGDPECPFRLKCADIERLDAAYLAWQAQQ